MRRGKKMFSNRLIRPLPKRPNNLRRGYIGDRETFLPKLREANIRFARKDYQKAAMLFLKIASDASENGNPRAARFYFQASRAYLYAGDPDEAVAQFIQGQELLLLHLRYREIEKNAERMIIELRNLNYNSQIQEIEDWIAEKGIQHHSVEQPDSTEITDTTRSTQQKPRLPVECPNCGAAISPLEVEWVSNDSVECSYCGCIIRAQEE